MWAHFAYHKAFDLSRELFTDAEAVRGFPHTRGDSPLLKAARSSKARFPPHMRGYLGSYDSITSNALEIHLIRGVSS